MDRSRCDAWTRRHVCFATGGLFATLLTFGPALDGVAKRKKRRNNKKKCGRNKKRCQETCIKRSHCCGDGDCLAGDYCCEGECVSRETCCGGPYCPEGYPCRRAVEGDQICVSGQPVLCTQCASSEDCALDERCVLADCGDVTATCRPIFVT
jgi:hypothetical protein